MANAGTDDDDPVSIIVLAKSPIVGRVKTRLCPPCTPQQAAALAQAALVDTLRVVSASACARRILVIDGPVGPWCPDNFDVRPQRGEGLDERLAAAFADVGGPSILVGMDTPQITPQLLDDAVATLRAHDAVFGPAHDGGYWLIGLRRPDPRVFLGVPMSVAHTGAAQLSRLASLGLRHRLLPALRDVDTVADAVAVAAAAPGTAFAAAFARIEAFHELRAS